LSTLAGGEEMMVEEDDLAEFLGEGMEYQKFKEKLE